jgi:hypothetical protein
LSDEEQKTPVTVQPERSQKSLGKVSNAANFLNSHRRKSEVERPLSTTHCRVEEAGKVAILEQNDQGWTIITQQGVFINPWKNRPFSTYGSAAHVIRRVFRKGKWPTKKARRIYP